MLAANTPSPLSLAMVIALSRLWKTKYWMDTRVKMKGSKFLSAILAGTLLATQGCERHEERIFHMIRCTMAASVEKQNDPLIVKSWEITGLYMRENGIKKNLAELTKITANVRDEIMGSSDSSWDERDTRVNEIVNSEFCKAYLNLLQQK